MFETMTYENILDSMLNRVTSNVDKREGSVIYDALTPCAYQLAQAYFELNNYIDLFFIDTSVGEYLDRKAEDCGLTRKNATYAVRKIEASGVITIGTRWGIGDVSYVITDLISENNYSAICEQSGNVGNIYSGNLQSIDNADGQVTAKLTEILVSGSDEESDDNLRERMKQYLISPEQNANAAQYLKWATDFEGIGRAKVFPLKASGLDTNKNTIMKDAGNSVTIAITNASFKHAEDALVQDFQKYIDPDSKGLGNGVAPIGCKVYVTKGTPVNIVVAANVILENGYTSAEGAEKAVTDYLASITYVKNRISYMQLGSILLDCTSIAEINSLTVNGGTADIIMTEDQIPELGNLNITVVTS